LHTVYPRAGRDLSTAHFGNIGHFFPIGPEGRNGL
jgi:hypothetical protein